MCDRTHASPRQFAASQIGFIDAVVQPLLEGICLHLPALRERLVENLDSARSHWLQESQAPDAPAAAADR